MYVRYIIFCVYEPSRSVRNFYSADVIQCVYCLLQLVLVFFLELNMQFEALLGFQHPHRHAEKITTPSARARATSPACFSNIHSYLTDRVFLRFAFNLVCASIAALDSCCIFAIVSLFSSLFALHANDYVPHIHSLFDSIRELDASRSLHYFALLRWIEDEFFPPSSF